MRSLSFRMPRSVKRGHVNDHFLNHVINATLEMLWNTEQEVLTIPGKLKEESIKGQLISKGTQQFSTQGRGRKSFSGRVNGRCKDLEVG